MGRYESGDKTDIAVGRHVVVVGGGMTAVDAAVQARKLGAEDVAIAYRRGQDAMSASRYEQELAQANGVRIVTQAQPKSFSRSAATFGALTSAPPGNTLANFWSHASSANIVTVSGGNNTFEGLEPSPSTGATRTLSKPRRTRP